MKHSIRDTAIDLGDLGERDGFIEGDICRSSGVIYCNPKTVRIVIFKDDDSEFDVTDFATLRAKEIIAIEIEENYELIMNEPEDCMELAKRKREDKCG